MKTTGSPVVFLCIKSNKQGEKTFLNFVNQNIRKV